VLTKKYHTSMAHGMPWPNCKYAAHCKLISKARASFADTTKDAN